MATNEPNNVAHFKRPVALFDADTPTHCPVTGIFASAAIGRVAIAHGNSGACPLKRNNRLPGRVRNAARILHVDAG